MSEPTTPATPTSEQADSRDYAKGGFLLLGRSPETTEVLELKFANRHGLVTGATGTGKTVTLQVLAEGFSAAGVPVFVADIKGDLAGISMVGKPSPKLLQRAQEIGLTRYGNTSFPVALWDIFGERGHPVRTTIDEMGPMLLSRLLDLSEPQEGVLNIAFRWCADQREKGEKDMVIRDLKALRAVIDEMGKKAASLRSKYGNIAPATVGVIQRRLLVLEQQGADRFFGEPALDILDFICCADDGRGVVNILAAEKLMETPKLYSTFLLWMLSELFDKLPEVGDLDKPKLVFLFDEAHLLFNDAPRAVLEQIERVTRLIRSKGVGVFYVTQSPLDVPDRVSAQLGNRIQHALRAFTPREQKAVRAAAETFRANPEIDTEQAIQQLTTGEALVSVLRGKGEPSVVQRTKIRPPMSRLGPITDEERAGLITADAANHAKYASTVDLPSAYHAIQERNTAFGQVKQFGADVTDAFGSLLGKIK